MFVLTLIFYFKSKSKRNLVAKVPTKPEFLVAKEKMLVALATILVAILNSAKAAFIMYTVGGQGGREYFLKGQNFLRSPPYHTQFFTTPALDQKKKLGPPFPPHPVLTRPEEDIKVQALYFFEAQIPSQSTSATEVN